MAKRGGNNIFAEAKKLRKKDGDRKTWQQYVKQASAMYSSKHHGHSPVGHKHKKKSRKRKTRLHGLTTKSKTHTDQNRFKNVDIQIGGIGMAKRHTRTAKQALNHALDKLVLKKYHATTKTKKKKIQKEISTIKSGITAANKILK